TRAAEARAGRAAETPALNTSYDWPVAFAVLSGRGTIGNVATDASNHEARIHPVHGAGDRRRPDQCPVACRPTAAIARRSLSRSQTTFRLRVLPVVSHRPVGALERRGTASASPNRVELHASARRVRFAIACGH